MEFTRRIDPMLVFKGTGTKLSFEEHMNLHGQGVSAACAHTFQKTGWVDESILKGWLNTVLIPWRNREHGAGTWILLLLDACGTTHKVKSFQDACHAARIELFYGPANLTARWQPWDRTIGKQTKALMGQQLMTWLENSRNLRKWTSGKGFTASLKRKLALKWCGRAMTQVCSEEYRAMHHAAWVGTGCGIRPDGVGDSDILPQGMPGYVVPAP